MDVNGKANVGEAVLKPEILRGENGAFWSQIISLCIFYFLTTAVLNHFRTRMSVWLLWPGIGIQLVQYFSIFVHCYRRSVVMGLNGFLAAVLFPVLAIVGRVEDCEVIVIPLMVAVSLYFSAKNKNVSPKWRTTVERYKPSSPAP